MAAPRRVSSDSPAVVSPQRARSAVALRRAARLTGVHPTVIEVLAEINRMLGDNACPKRVRLMHRLFDQAVAAPPRELSRVQVQHTAAWCAREALRKAGVHEVEIDEPLTALAGGGHVSLVAVADALVALERLDTDTNKAAGRARYACEVALGLCSTGEDWRERFTLAARHATAAVALASGSDADLERFFGLLVRRIAG